MQLTVRDMAGQEVSTLELPAEIFEAKINEGLMWQYYMMQRHNARLGTAKALRRGEVNRTHAKWYRQKGTGRARHGSRNAPIFVGGGVAHGPVPHKYTRQMPKKMRHAALKSALSSLARDNQIILVDHLTFETAKTKLALSTVRALVGEQRVLILMPGRDEMAERSFRNLPNVTTLHASYINVRDLLRFDQVVIPLAALDVIKTLLAKPPREATASASAAAAS